MIMLLWVHNKELGWQALTVCVKGNNFFDVKPYRSLTLQLAPNRAGASTEYNSVTHKAVLLVVLVQVPEIDDTICLVEFI